MEEKATDLFMSMIKNIDGMVKTHLSDTIQDVVLRTMECKVEPTDWKYRIDGNEHWFYSAEDPKTFDDLDVVEAVALYEHPLTRRN